MKKISESIIPLVLIAFFIFLNSCEYKNSDVNFVQIDQNVPPPNLTSNIDFNSDTLYFRQDYYYYWQFSCDKKILRVDFRIDGFIYKSFENTSNGSLQFDDSFFTSLNYRNFTCVVYIKSGTGSIADKLNAEAVFMDKDFVAVFVPNTFVPSTISKINHDNLDVVIDYNRYTGPDFKAYYLVKNYTDTVAVNYNQDLLQLRDTTYSGEDAEYELITAIKSNSELNKSDRKIFNDYPDYKVTYLGNNEYKFTIPKNKYNSRLSRVRFYEQTNYYDNYQLLNETTINDVITFTVKNLKFQPDIGYQLMFVPKTDLKSLKIAYNLPRFSINIRTLGYNFSDFNFIGGGENSQVYLTDGKGNVLCYNTQKEQIDTLASTPGYSGYFAVSASGKNLIVNNGNNSFKIYKVSDNSVINSISSSDLKTPVSYTYTALSDNGIFAYYDYSTIIIYDYINKKELQRISVKTSGNYLYISSDGSLLATEKDVFTLVNGSYEFVTSLQGTFVSIDPGNPYQGYYQYQNELVLYNFNTVSRIKSFQINSNVSNIDWNSRSIIYVENKKLIFKSLDDGSVVNSFDLRYDGSAYNYRFYNKTLFFHDNSAFILKFE